MAGYNYATKVAHNLLSIDVGHERREANHSVKYTHNNCFVKKLSILFPDFIERNSAYDDHCSDYRHSFTKYLSEQMVFQNNHYN